MLVEVCRDDEIADAHKLIEHYGADAARSRDMMAGPRASEWYQAAFLAISEHWKSGGP